MRQFLLATGPHGLGYQAVYGAPTIGSLQEFELLWYLNQRVNLVQTEEGRKQLELEHAAETMQEVEAHKTDAPLVFDPYTQTPEEIDRLVKQARKR